MSKLSKKQSDELYDVIHNDIMDARVKAVGHLKKHGLPWGEIDEIFYNLTIKAPESAMKIFK